MSKAYIATWRSRLFMAVMVAAFAVVFVRLYDLHVLRGDELALEAQNNRRSVIPLEGRRGNIVDRDGNLLAGVRSLIQVGVDPYLFTASHREKLPELAQILGLPLAEIEAAVDRRFREGSDGQPGRAIRWAPLAVVNDEVYDQVRALGIRPVYGNRRYERFYPGGSLAAHLIGYVNREETAVMGVERALDFYLKGEQGWREAELDGRRREVVAFRAREVLPRDGYHVELTIDQNVQSIVEQALRKLAETYDPAGATIIISDPRTGDILALGNYPSFDPNHFNRFPIENQRNRAVTDVYEPGSTFKIVPVAAGLEERLVRPETLIDCETEVVHYRGRNIRLPSDTSRLGTIPLTRVVSRSSNRGSAQIGMMLGEQRLYDYAHAFGFGQSTGWLLGGEVRGTLHSVRDWDGLMISRIPAGYAVSATPLQVHQSMAAIANEGVLMVPRIASRILDADGRTVLDFPSAERGQVVSAITAERVAEMLRGVIGPDGTARRAEIEGYQVAGKTGTSRKIINGQYSNRHHVASFSGFFPASNPRVVITVMVDEPRLPGTGYGGLVAAPVFKEVGEQLIHHLGIQKPESTEPLFVSR